MADVNINIGAVFVLYLLILSLFSPCKYIYLITCRLGSQLLKFLHLGQTVALRFN